MVTKVLHHIANFLFSKRLRLIGITIFSIFISLQSFGQSFILDVQYNPMSFTNARRTVFLDKGNNGTTVGSIHKYSNVITLNGITVYAKMTILDNHNALITNFDDDVLTGDINRFQPRIGSSKNDGGYVTYQLEFFDTQTNYPVYIYNYYLTAIDIDGSGSNKEYVEVGGYSSYQKSSQCGLTITSDAATGRTRFLGISSSLPDVTFDNTASFIANFLNANNRITFTLGQTGQNDERFYSVQFGAAGGTLTNPLTVNNPLPIAIDDNASVNYFTSGSPVTAINNVLTNDLYNGVAIIPSQVTITQLTPPSNPGVVFNTTTGKVTVAPGTPGGPYTFTYKVTLNAVPANVDVATVTVNVLQADLKITKSVTQSPVLAGQNITYTITVTNSGPTDAQNVAVSDQLSSNLSNITTTPSVGSWTSPNWTIGTLASGSTATLSINAKVLPTFSGAINNSATVTSSTPDPNTNDNTANANLSVTALSGPTATNDIATTNINTPVTIPVLSNDVAGSGAIVNTSVTFVAGTTPDPATVGTFSFNSTTHLVTFTPATGFMGAATVTYKILDANGLSGQATITCTILKADISITKTAALSIVNAEQVVTYTLTAHNNGPNDALTVSASDVLPANLTVTGATASTGTVWSAPNWTIGTLANGSTATLTIVAKVAADYSGSLVNNVSITSPTGDPTPGNNTASVTTPVTALTGPVANPDVALTNINTAVTFNVVTNDTKGTGNIVASSVIFVGTIPDPATVGVFTINTSGDVTFNPVNGFMGVAIINYKITDANGLTSQTTISCTIIKADLEITKTAALSVEGGNQIVTYTIKITNNGPDQANAVIATDILPTSLTINSAAPSIGTWTAPTWTIGNMANGATATLIIVAKVGGESTGSLTNTSTVTSTTADPVLTNNTATVISTTASGPHAVDDIATTTVNTTIPIIVLTNDTKGSSDIAVTSVTFVPGTEPAATVGVFTADPISGIVSFQPANGYIGTTSIKYQILDVNGLSSQATITVTVTPSLINNFPAKGFGTLAFEDLWPSKGDYDFNDLVLDYKFEVTTNANNFVEKVKGTFVIKAFGASLENGFGFQLSGTINANDLTVTGSSLTDGYINLNDKGTETGQTKPTIIVYDNAFKQMKHPGVGIGVNTDPSAPYVTPKTIEITINFKPNTYTYNDLDISSFNPFLIVNKVRGVEVHLPNYAPTSLANTSLFGTVDDNSSISQSKYYKTASNLPWAINIYSQFDYPIEKSDILLTHLHFAEWVTSGGTSVTDWFLNKPGYRKANLIYQRP